MTRAPKVVANGRSSLSRANIDLPPRSIIKCKRADFQRLPPSQKSLVSGMVNRPLNHLADHASTDKWMFLGSSETKGQAKALATEITLKCGLQADLAQDPLLAGLVWFLCTGTASLFLTGTSASLFFAEQLVFSLTTLALAVPLLLVGGVHLLQSIRARQGMTRAQKLLAAESMTTDHHPAVVASLNEAANARIRLAGLELPSIIDSDMRAIVNAVEHELLELQQRYETTQVSSERTPPSDDFDSLKIEQACNDLDTKVKAAIKQASTLARQ